MKRLLLVLVLIAAVFFSGCVQKQEEQPNVGAIKTSMMKAANNLSSYNFTATHNQTDAVDENGNTKASNMTVRIASSSVSASIDLKNHKARANINTLTSLKAPGEAARIASSNGTQYNIDNMTYTKSDRENWTSLKDPTPEWALWASGRYNALWSRAESINESQISVLGSEVVDGKDCYKLSLITNDSVYNQTLSNAVGSVIFPFVTNLNMTSLRKNSQIEALTWIEKDNNLIRRYEYRLKLSVVPDLVGVLNLSNGQIMMFNQSLKASIKPVEVSIDINNQEYYFDLNKPLKIAPPIEAQNASPIVPVVIQNTTA